MQKSRPVWFAPLAVTLPIGGIVSLLHRLSGLLLFLFLPYLLFVMGELLKSEQSYRAMSHASGAFPKLLACVLLWAGLHHLFAGIRFLILDTGLGKSLTSARRSARWVLGLVAFSFLAGVWLW